MASSDIRNKLLFLGVQEDYLDDYVVMFSNASNPKEFINEFAQSIGKDGFGAGYEQIVGPIFTRLYESNPEIKAEVLRRTSNLGIPQEAVNYYFSDPNALVLRFEYGDEIDYETHLNFVDTAELLMLQLLKKYLSLDKK